MSQGRSPHSRLSPLSGTILAALFLAGIAYGAVEYARRSPVAERHVGGSNAITIHVFLAIAAAAAVIGIQAWRSRHPEGERNSPWTAPFSVAALSRLSRTIRFEDGVSPARMARAVAAVPLLLVLLYCPFRMGIQITGGLDPDATVNAWGGPTYAGALLAHWLDSLVLFYAAAFLLSRVLLAAPRPALSRVR